MTKSAHGRKYATGHLDQDDRLVQVSKGVYASGAVLENEFTVQYSYDSMGRMLRRDNGSEVTTFVWDGWDLLSEETDSVVTTYLVPDGLVWSFSRGEDVFQVHTDALGSIRVVTDSDGDVVARFEYGAWGELLPGSFDDVGLALRFVGGLGVRTDLETGLLWMRHRWYDAELQRFISRDPIGLRGGANLYGYVGANPTRLVDPIGLDPTLAIQAGAGAIIVDTALLGTAAASATVVVPAAILGVGILDGMRPVPGTGRGPFFGDSMGADRWGGRVYEVPTLESRAEQRGSGVVSPVPFKPLKVSPNKTGNPRPGHSPPGGTPDCSKLWTQCLYNVNAALKEGPHCGKPADDCFKTYLECKKAVEKGQRWFHVHTQYWPYNF